MHVLIFFYVQSVIDIKWSFRPHLCLQQRPFLLVLHVERLKVQGFSSYAQQFCSRQIRCWASNTHIEHICFKSPRNGLFFVYGRQISRCQPLRTVYFPHDLLLRVGCIQIRCRRHEIWSIKPHARSMPFGLLFHIL